MTTRAPLWLSAMRPCVLRRRLRPLHMRELLLEGHRARLVLLRRRDRELLESAVQHASLLLRAQCRSVPLRDEACKGFVDLLEPLIVETHTVQPFCAYTGR